MGFSASEWHLRIAPMTRLRQLTTALEQAIACSRNFPISLQEKLSQSNQIFPQFPPDCMSRCSPASRSSSALCAADPHCCSNYCCWQCCRQQWQAPLSFLAEVVVHLVACTGRRIL